MFKNQYQDYAIVCIGFLLARGRKDGTRHMHPVDGKTHCQVGESRQILEDNSISYFLQTEFWTRTEFSTSLSRRLLAWMG